MKKRLLSALLIAASVFIAALPAQAQWINITPTSPNEVQSNTQWGTHVTVQIWNTRNTANGYDLEWYIIDGSNQILDSGTLIPWYDEYYDVRSGKSYFEQEYNVSNNGYRLVMNCNGGCTAEADFVVN